MSTRVRPLALPAAFLLAVFAMSAVVGYVYSHEPARDTLVVEYEGTPTSQSNYVTGAVAVVEGDTLTLSTGSGGQRDITLPLGTPVEALERIDEAPGVGARVNVGVDDTDFGLVLTGVVAIEEAR